MGYQNARQKGRKIKKKSTVTKQPKENPFLMMKLDSTFSLQNKLIQMNTELQVNKENETKENLAYMWSLNDYFKDDLKPKVEGFKKTNIKGFTSLYLNRSESKILLSSIDHSLNLYDVVSLTQEPPKVFKGLKSTYYVKSVLSPCDNFVICGSKDETVYLWEANNHTGTPLAAFNGTHKGEVNAVDWGLGTMNFIASVSDDETLLVWDYNSE